MSYVALLSITLVLIFLYVWKHHIKPRQLLKEYKKVIEKEGFVVSLLNAGNWNPI